MLHYDELKSNNYVKKTGWTGKLFLELASHQQLKIKIPIFEMVCWNPENKILEVEKIQKLYWIIDYIVGKKSWEKKIEEATQ